MPEALAEVGGGGECAGVKVYWRGYSIVVGPSSVMSQSGLRGMCRRRQLSA